MEYRQGSHTKFRIEYHFVWVTKYRYQVLMGDLALRVRELVRQTCERYKIHILRGVVSKDHVHILISAPPTIAPSTIMRWVKGRTSRKIFEEFPRVKHCCLIDFAMGKHSIEGFYLMTTFQKIKVQWKKG